MRANLRNPWSEGYFRNLREWLDIVTPLLYAVVIRETGSPTGRKGKDMGNRFTQHPERATNTGHPLTEDDLRALSYFVLTLLDTDGAQETVAGVEALDRLLSDLSKGGIPEAMTLGDLLHIARQGVGA